MTLGYFARLEPSTRSDDLMRGIAARTYDAAWLLARQWQVGNFNGEDAGSPASVRHVGQFARTTQLKAGGAGRAFESTTQLLDAETESIAPQITTHRRVALGASLLRAFGRRGIVTDELFAKFKFGPGTEPE